MIDESSGRGAFAQGDGDASDDAELGKAASALFGDGFWGREMINPAVPKRPAKG